MESNINRGTFKDDAVDFSLDLEINHSLKRYCIASFL